MGVRETTPGHPSGGTVMGILTIMRCASALMLALTLSFELDAVGAASSVVREDARTTDLCQITISAQPRPNQAGRETRNHHSSTHLLFVVHSDSQSLSLVRPSQRAVFPCADRPNEATNTFRYQRPNARPPRRRSCWTPR